MTNKERLHELELKNSYVFHGSPDGNIEMLEPRQGRHIPDLSNPTQFILDGNPAVSATPYADIAIFRAIINRKNIKLDYNSGFSVTNGKPYFRVASQDVLYEAKDKKGFVYIFDKKEFEPYSRDGNARPESMEWRSYKPIKPLDKIEVYYDDLSLGEVKVSERW